MNQKRILISISLLILSSMLFSACTPAVIPTPAAVAATAAPKQEVPATVQPTKVVPVFMTVNVEQVSTWTRNFNPF